MPLLRGRRPLKRWRYVGLYGPDFMLCVGSARVAIAPLHFWAVIEPDGRLLERTTMSAGGVRVAADRVTVRARGARVDLELSPLAGSEPVEVVSPAGAHYVWTRKHLMRARGLLEAGGVRREIDQEAFVDDSAGYHERHTQWKWSAGVGVASGGERVAWNLVTGVHDAPGGSERTVWVDGHPSEAPPVRFSGDLGSIESDDGSRVDFSEWGARTDNTNLLLFRSRYRQPFGTFTGELPGGVALAEGYGVMEDHDVFW
jgi:Domain of unknown function (DUF2804), C-terminal